MAAARPDCKVPSQSLEHRLTPWCNISYHKLAIILLFQPHKSRVAVGPTPFVSGQARSLTHTYMVSKSHTFSPLGMHAGDPPRLS